VYGARPFRRAVQQILENLLSKGIFSQESLPEDHVIVDNGESGLILVKAGHTAKTA